ncbi:odorant receptor 43a-like [Schistocerca serialis cubense]|uniref:odorant receptor 43a-like n=1 Tax=Schistocerca serialis cubense TaxID=2023355 RepID=UPI00214F366D|nr:odorant receptor 43a-like [Schistocerca serialis cubense]
MNDNLSWTASGKSVLMVNIRHLWVLGIWELGETSLFTLQSMIAFGMGAFIIVDRAVAVYFIWGNFELTTLVLLISFTGGSGVVKMAVFAYNRRQYHSLANQLDKLLSLQRGSCSEDPNLAAILASSRRKAARLTKGLLLLMLSQTLLWMSVPLVAYPEESRLPFVQHQWDHNNNFYGISYIVQCLSAVWVSQISLGVDCLFASVMIIVAAQLEILVHRLLDVRNDADIVCKETAVLEKKKVDSKSDQNMYDELRVCIKTHQDILRFVAYLQDTMSPIAMTQFVMSVVIACMALFQATYSEEFSAVLKCASFLTIPVGQLYLYCWAATNVTAQAEAVSAAIYSCSWVDASERFKRALRVIISRSQKPLVLTAGHLYPIDKEAFLTLVNASYSYYALLSQMYNR